MGCSPENNWNVNVRYKNVSVAAEKAETGDDRSPAWPAMVVQPRFSHPTHWSKVQPSFKTRKKMPCQVHCQVWFQWARLKMAMQGSWGSSERLCQSLPHTAPLCHWHQGSAAMGLLRLCTSETWWILKAQPTFARQTFPSPCSNALLGTCNISLQPSAALPWPLSLNLSKTDLCAMKSPLSLKTFPEHWTYFNHFRNVRSSQKHCLQWNDL